MFRSRWLLPGKRKCFLLFPIVLCLFFFLNAPTALTPIAQAGATLVMLDGNVSSSLIAHSQVLGPAEQQQQLSMHVVLRLRNVDALQQYLHDLYLPGSSHYHQYLRPSDFAALYAPTLQDVTTVRQYLEAQGLQVTRIAPGGEVIDFSGSVLQAERAFGIQMQQYRASDGHTFVANTSSPRLPLALHTLIQYVGGLNEGLQRHTHVTSIHTQQGVSPNISCPTPGTENTTIAYTPAQLASAYNVSGLYNAGYHGEGQNVALFELDSYTSPDISNYQACFDSNSPTRIATKLVDNGPGAQGAGGLEVEQDMQIVLGMLPRLSNLFVYEAPNTDTGYNDEWAQILNDDVPVVSTSWGTCEANLATADVMAEQQFFMQAAAQGQSLLAASGDSGAYDCGSSALSVDDPGSNPFVTSVGGTSLRMGGNATYSSETSWSNTPNAGYGSGGGISQLWSMPNYQVGAGVANASSSGAPCHAASGQYCREVPDVALDADPSTGYVVYCTVSASGCSAASPFISAGGTSAAAPMWAALVALANQYALAHGGSNLGFLNPLLYTLLASPNSYSQDFHDIASGSNLFYNASVGYDMATGLGSYNAYNLVLAATASATPRVVPGNTRWYFAEGHLGNHFQEYVTLENPSVSSIAHVVINYLLRGRGPASQALTLNPSTRTTVNVNTLLNVSRLSLIGQDVSLVIISDIPILAERPMYFTFGGITPGGSDIIGTTQPGQHFVFANGSTVWGYNTFLTILNPLGQPAANVTATYYSGGIGIGRTTISAPTGQRSTIPVNGVLAGGKQFFIQIDADQPIVVERPLYFHTTVPGIAGTVIGGSSVPGILPQTNWYFPTGDTGRLGAAKENLILANPDMNGTRTTATVSILYAWGNGTTKTVNVAVAAKNQAIESVNADVGAGQIVAMKVSATNGIPIVAERQQFFSYPSLVPTPSGVEVLGTTDGGHGLSSVYSFAEGHLGSSFSEYMTLFNPNNTGVRVSVTYFITNGARQTLSQQQVSLSPMGVMQLPVNTFLNVSSSATTASGVATDVSLVVQSMTSSNRTLVPIVAERSLYFNFVGATPGATSVVGYGGN